MTYGWILWLTFATARPVVAIDPGHGGEQYGALGVCGIYEKDVALAISQRLSALLTATGQVTPILTRSTDATVSLEDRSRLANEGQAVLFVSIHGNSAEQPSWHGVEIYFLSRQAADRRTAKLAHRENDQRPAPDTKDDALNQILNGLLLQAAHSESQRFGSRVVEAMVSVMGTSGRGLLQAPFIVLKNAKMPAVLVELGFLSNDADCAALADSRAQDTIAKALATAILAHLGTESSAATRQ